MAAIITIQTTGEGQGWAKEGTTGAAGARGTTCLEPLSMFFFFFTFAYLLSTKFLFALRTTLMSTISYHHHTPSPSPERTQARDADASRVLVCKFFFCPLLNDYIFLDCTYRTTTRMTTANGHHLWDNEQGLEMHHLCLESLVCFFYFFRYVFSFFFFYYSFNLPQCVHHHHHYHPQQQYHRPIIKNVCKTLCLFLLSSILLPN